MSPAELFAEESVFLAHCAGFAKGVGNNETDAFEPLERLRNVVENGPEISCSTIGTDDRRVAGLEFGDSNFTGDIGLIILPFAFSAITHASRRDGGTLPPLESGGPRRNTNGRNSPDEVRLAIRERPPTEYNEICSNGYEVIGIFMAQNPARFTDGEEYEFQEVLRAFDDLPFFFFLKGLLHQVLSADETRQIPINEIYARNLE